MSRQPIEKLTDAEKAYLEKPVKELQTLGLLPTAMAALDKKFASNRAENEAYKERG